MGGETPRRCWSTAAQRRPDARKAHRIGLRRRLWRPSGRRAGSPRAERAPAEHAAHVGDPVAERDPAIVDREADEPLVVVALSHLEDAQPARELGLELEVAQEEDVAEEEREAAEAAALTERGDLVREDRGAGCCSHESAERPDI